LVWWLTDPPTVQAARVRFRHGTNSYTTVVENSALGVLLTQQVTVPLQFPKDREPECSRLNTEGKEDVVIAHTHGVITILPSS